LRDTLGSRRDANKVEITKELVITDQFTFTLINLDFNGCLAISSSGKYLGFLCRNGGVAV